MNSPPRILHIVSAMNRGGAETLLMNIDRQLDRSTMQFDFVSHRLDTGDFDEEIMQLGGRVFHTYSLRQLGPWRYVRSLTNLMREHGPYDVVHAHTDYLGGFAAKAAWLAGVPVRICHSHNNNWGFPTGGGANLALRYLRELILRYATGLGACSDAAARFLFAAHPATIIHNGIDLAPYAALGSSARRAALATEFHIADSTAIIGHIGRFAPQKNHGFLLRLCKALQDDGMDFVALLIGDGPLRAKMEAQAARLGLQQQVRFLGIRTDIPQLLYACDLFLLPSLFEGFGIVLLEAQAAGTPCLAADTMPTDTDMGMGIVQYLPLQENFAFWRDAIRPQLQKRQRAAITDTHRAIRAHGFEIQATITALMHLYGFTN